MQPLINKVKTLALSLHEKLEEGLRENKRRIDNLRAKVIVLEITMWMEMRQWKNQFFRVA